MQRLVDPDSFGFLIADLSRLLRVELDRRVAEAGLGITAGEGRVLAHAARAGTVRQNVLAERMGVEPMTLSGFIDRLEAYGLVTRSIDPSDRRARLIELTGAAEGVLAELRGIAAEIREQASQSIAGEDWQRLMEALKQARSNLAANRDGASRRGVASDAA